MSKHKGKEYVWLLVTTDKYELPLALTETATEMSALTGVKPSSIIASHSHWKHGDINSCRFRRVEIV